MLRVNLHSRVLNLLESGSIGHREISSLAFAINGGVFVSFDGVTQLIFEGQVIVVRAKTSFGGLFWIQMLQEPLIDLLLIFDRLLFQVSNLVRRFNTGYSMLGGHL